MQSILKLFSLSIALFLWMPASISADVYNEPISGSDSWVNEAVQTSANDVLTDHYAASIASALKVDNLQDLKTAIYSGLTTYEKNIRIDYTGKTANLKAELSSVLQDIFEEDVYLYGTISQWLYKYDGYVNDVAITLSIDYLTDAQQEQFVDSEVGRILGTIIIPGMNQFQQVKAVNDYIILNTAYSFDTVASPHSAYAILHEGKGVCQAYALLAYKMLDQLGFDVHYVTGYAGGELHAWNLVKVDGKWYDLDTTWNDPTPNRIGQVNYNYFLVTDDQLRKDHTWVQGNFPVAVSGDYAFMHDITHGSLLDNGVYYRSELNGDKLYKMDFTTMEKTKLTDSRAIYVTAFGQEVYFSNYSNGARLTKINTDGTNETALNEIESTHLYIEHPYLYYTTKGGSLEKIKISTANIPIDPVVFDPAIYTMWQENETADLKKEWRIQLNAPVNKSTVTNQTVYIVDIEGNRLPSIEPIVENKQTIRLMNNNTFSANTHYYVIIESGVTSTGGKALKKGVVMPFLVK